MRMSLGLQARQSQVQKLAPRMIQSMEILQLPMLALQERIEQEMNENPLLEQQDADPLAPDEGDKISPTATPAARTKRNWSSITITTTRRTSSGCST